MPAKFPIDETVLRRMVDDDIQNRLIADHFGCHECTIENRLKKLGIKKLRTGPKSGNRHNNWKGGMRLVSGYWHRYMPEHPNCHIRSGIVAEHRLIMENKLGRYLDRKEVVHHVDGNPLNNHPDNLIVFGCNADHLRHELTGKCPNWTEDGKRRIVYGIRKAAEQKRSLRQSKSGD